MAKSNKNNRKKRNMLSVCFWILVLVLIAVVFFVKRNDIKRNLDETDFFGRVFGKTPSFVADSKTSGNQEKQPETIDIDLLGRNSSEEKYSEATGTEANQKSPEEIEPVREIQEAAEKSEKNVQESRIDSKTENDKSEDKNTSASQSQQKNQSQTKSQQENQAKNQSAAVPEKREVTLYFITIDSDGSVNRKSVKRSLAKSDSPLTDSINTLLQGPSLDEKSKNMMTLIPGGTKLLGASVKNGTATLNFSEDFEFNTVGVEGYIAQLMQIVFTATEFPTVKNVQFLIEGERKEYLGNEALQWIGTPLARSSF